MKKPLVVHPFLLGIYFILNAFTLLYKPSLVDLSISMFMILTGIFALYLVIELINKDRVISAIICTLILIPLLFYAQILSWVFQNFRALAHHRYIMPAVITLTVISVWLAAKTKRRLRYLNSYLNILTAIYVIYGIVLVTTSFAGDVRAPQIETPKIICNSGASQSFDTAGLPDIYYIILDGYAGSEILKKYFNYDNSDFTGKLKSRGFYIAEKSRSFSGSTEKAVASTLNMTNDRRILAAKSEVLHDLIKNSAVERFLGSKSYEIINLSIFDLSKSPKFYRAFLRGTTSNFEKIFNTFLGCIIIQELKNVNRYIYNLKILSILKELPVKRQDRPRFIYAHLMTPHYPYAFDRNANVIPWLKRSFNHKEGYIEQLTGTNKLAIEAVNAILAKSSVKPVVILQGDHGYIHNIIGEEESAVEPISHYALNAYYFPNGGDRYLYESISPFNIFRLIFNFYFGEKIELLKDD